MEEKTLLGTLKTQIDQSPEHNKTYVKTNEYKYTQKSSRPTTLTVSTIKQSTSQSDISVCRKNIRCKEIRNNNNNVNKICEVNDCLLYTSRCV